MSTMSERNPFVGPRALQRNDELHGRDKEVSSLYLRLEARRIVVLHSPSGAGKSSLVQAGLIPRLLEEGYDVWSTIRVNLDPRGLGVPEATNRYVLSAMVSLEEDEAIPLDRRRGPAELAELSFHEYLRSRPRRPGQEDRPVVLLFDQFEEVLTVAPRDVEGKRELFAQLGRALDDEDYWALFIIREDYLAALAPYRDKIPTQLSNTFRIDLLDRDEAREAAVKLAHRGGREFPAVDKLVRDLSTVQVQQVDGRFTAEQGQYVEPVLLQVVCHQLWAAMPDDDLSIDEADIEQYAGISRALGGYYAKAVGDIARGDAAVERSIREWVGSKLIVGGIRSQVRQETHRSAGLDNGIIEQLRNVYFVRAEQRAGATWFELSHDRLLEPIRLSNEEWEETHLHPLQVQAKLWEREGRPQTLLLEGQTLRDAEEWTRVDDARVTDTERAFVEQSRTRQRARASRRIAWVTVAVVFAAVVSVLFVQARTARDEATASAAQATKAKAKAETAKAELEKAHAEKDALQLELERLIQESNEVLGRSETLAEIINAPLADITTPRASKELVRRHDGTPLRDSDGREIYAINLWVDLPDIRQTDVERVKYFLDHPSFNPKHKIGDDPISGFAVTYTGWGCLEAVPLTLEDDDGEETEMRFDLCRALGWDGDAEEFVVRGKPPERPARWER